MPDVMGAILSIVAAGHVALSWQVGGIDGGVILTPVEILGGFGTAGGVIAYLFKLYAARVEAEIKRIIDAHAVEMARRDKEAERIIAQNNRFADALWKYSSVADRSLAAAENQHGGRPDV